MAGEAPGSAPEDQARTGVPRAPARLALYRRYRPATFAEVRGQEHVTQPLMQALRNGRVNHAYLFSGPRGCGKTSSARILARSLNCAQGPTPEPCGVCDSCVALAPSGPGSIDVIEIDAASHGGVDDARDLRERAFYAPVSGRFKVYIIDEAHMVTREGFNALLKLVEEPPPHLKFVFATTEPEKVIATIRSRTHHYPFRLVPPTVLRELLEEILAAEQVPCQPSVLPLVVRAGAGSVRDSLSVLDQLLAGAEEAGLTYERTVALLGYSDDALLDEMVDALAAGDGAAAFGTVDRVVQGGHDPRRFAADLLDRLRDLIILAAVPAAGSTGLLDVPADRLERMGGQASRFGQAELARAAGILSEGLIQMRGTASPRLLLELACAEILLPAAATDEKALLARLERLERRLDSAPAAAVPAAGRADGPATGQAMAPARPRTTGQAAAPAGPLETTDPAPQAAHLGTGPAGRARQAAPHAGPGGSGGSGRSGPAAHAAARPEPVSGHEPSPPGPPAADTDVAGTDVAGTDVAGTGVAGTGSADVQTLRERWPRILEAVKNERRVAWILLSPATVQSLEGNVLTIAFPREGEAKGFSTSGCDQVLTGVLHTMLGLNLRVRAVVGGGDPSIPWPAREAAQGPAQGAGNRTASAPHQAGDPATGQGAEGAPGPQSDAGQPGGPTRGRRRAGPRPASASAGQRAPSAATQVRGDRAPMPADRVPSDRVPGDHAPGHSASGISASGISASGASASGASASGISASGASASGASASGISAAGNRAPGGRVPAGPALDASGRPQPAPAYGEDEWPDDVSGPGGAPPGSAGLTGMELIQRQFGGTVIQEIEEG